MSDDRSVAEQAKLELEVMGTVAEALARIGDDAARGRVLDWAYSRFNVTSKGSSVASASGTLRHQNATSSLNLQDHASLGDLFAAADPSSETERALVAAFWIQTHEGNGSFTAQSVNGSLTHMGHGVSNITRTLGVLMGRRPKLVIQLEKAGKSRQARKTYKVTSEGERAVQALLSRPQVDDETRS
jgi:ATP-dependent exoDNAse (exonuclease V) alpha subunit